MKRRALWACLLFLAYAALAVVFTYPLARHFGTHHVGEAGGDAKIYLWNYWWVSRAVSEGTSPFATDAIFHPIGIGLAFHTLAPLQGLAFAPLSGVVGKVPAANLIVLWTFVASALATYGLARHVGAGRGGACLAGLVFAFCPYRMARLAGHYDLLGTEWIPLYALALLKSRERPWIAVVAGAIVACAAYTAATYAVFLALFTVLLLGFRRELWRRALVSAAVAVMLLTPLWVQAAHDLDRWSYPAYPGTEQYAASLEGYLDLEQTPVGSRQTEMATDPETDPETDRETDTAARAKMNLTERTVFAGYSVLALGLAGAIRVRSHPALPFWLTSAVVFMLLSLGGPPFRLLQQAPLLENLRAPARLSVLVMLSLAIVAALAVKGAAKGYPFTKKGYPFFAVCLAGVVGAEYLSIPVPLFPASVHPVYAALRAEPSAATVVEVPGIEQSAAEVMYHQTVHGKPVFVGTAARVPREKSDYYLGLPLVRTLIDLRKGKLELSDELVAREREAAPAVARFLGLGYFVLDKAYAKRGVVDFVERVLPVERWYEDESLVVLETRREALPPDPVTIDAASLQSRQHFESGWGRAEREDGLGFRWANRARSTLLFRRPERAKAIVIELAPLAGSTQELRVGTSRFALEPGWQDLRLDLPSPHVNSQVERITLHWSTLAQASERDPRYLAARVRRIWFE